jgi:hypothetical protein
MASEYKKIDNEYLENNSRRDFGLTSWAHADELFPWNPDETPMKEINNELNIIDWEKLGWDYEHSMSAHNLRGDPSIQSVKLWPRPSKFVLDGTECKVVYCDVTERNCIAMSRHRHNVASCHHDRSRRCCYSGVN